MEALYKLRNANQRVSCSGQKTLFVSSMSLLLMVFLSFASFVEQVLRVSQVYMVVGKRNCHKVMGGSQSHSLFIFHLSSFLSILTLSLSLIRAPKVPKMHFMTSGLIGSRGKNVSMTSIQRQCLLIYCIYGSVIAGMFVIVFPLLN